MCDVIPFNMRPKMYTATASTLEAVLHTRFQGLTDLAQVKLWGCCSVAVAETREEEIVCWRADFPHEVLLKRNEKLSRRTRKSNMENSIIINSLDKFLTVYCNMKTSITTAKLNLGVKLFFLHDNVFFKRMYLKFTL